MSYSPIYLTLPYLTLPYLTLPYLTLPYLTLPYLTFDNGRWAKPLIEWSSSADCIQGTRMTFSTKEDVMRFAGKQGALVLVFHLNDGLTHALLLG